MSTENPTAKWRVRPIWLGAEDRYFEVVSGRRTIVQTHAREVATCARWLAEDEANCHLIAAAPRLLKALRAIAGGDGEADVIARQTLEQVGLA